MMTFDPTALTNSLAEQAEILRLSGNAPATVVHFEQGSLSVSAATGTSRLHGGAAQPDQTLEIGSQTKMMTSVMILQLQEQGLIDLDARAAAYLPPDMVQGIANAGQATVRQLLNMTSGIGNYTEAVDDQGIPLFVDALLTRPDQVFGPAQALEIARSMQPTGGPGEGFYYSNTNYLLLGQIVQGLTGQSFIDALQSHVFNPAHMPNSVRQLSTDDPRLSSYADPGDGHLINVTRALWEMQGEAGVASNTEDMTHFLRALLVDKTLLGHDALMQMKGWLLTDDLPLGKVYFGLGLVKVALTDGHTFIGFTGGTLATGSSTYLDVTTGAIVSISATSAEVDTGSGGLALITALQQSSQWQPMADDGGALSVT